MDGKESFEKQKGPNGFKIRSPTNANPSNPSAFAGSCEANGCLSDIHSLCFVFCSPYSTR